MGMEGTASPLGQSEGRLSAAAYDVYFTLDRVAGGRFQLDDLELLASSLCG